MGEDQERPRGYSLQEQVREAELTIIKDSILCEHEIDQRDIRIDELETALKQVREIIYGADTVEDLSSAMDIIDEVIGG
jgi:hypothetical protein